MKILVADDDAISRTVLQHLLVRWGHEPVTACDGQEALAVMRGEDPPRLLLLDWEMPKLDGLEVCRELRSLKTDQPPYIIFVTAKDSASEIVRALEYGGSDFVKKPFNKDELGARIRVGVRNLELQAELVEARRQMEHLAMNDSLTGVYNRRAIMDILPREINRVERNNQCLAVALADLDHFKTVNDRFGHAVGDAVLVQSVKTLQQCVRLSDCIGRWGGEEFILLTAVDKRFKENHELPQLFERIRRAIEAQRVAHGNGAIAITTSIGVACASAESSVEAILHAADMALYQAKKEGRNRICCGVAHCDNVKTDA
jgi:two-component system cell cycle response regulator